MINSWSVETTETQDHNELNEAINTGFYTDQRADNKSVTVDQFKENLWLFGDMSKYKRR